MNLGPTTGEETTLFLKKNVQKINILVVEDDDVSWMLCEQLAIKRGWEASRAKDGSEAVGAFKSQQFSLVLMDIQLPIMNGYMATRAIREYELTLSTRTPIVGLTSNALQGDREKCIEAGMDDYMSKPLNVDVFYKTIIDFIE